MAGREEERSRCDWFFGDGDGPSPTSRGDA